MVSEITDRSGYALPAPALTLVEIINAAVADALALHVAESNPHNQYATNFETVAIAAAATIPAVVRQVIITGRDNAMFTRWVAPMASLYSQLADLAWFDDAGGQRWMLKPGEFKSKHIGCIVDGVTDDTLPAMAAAAWMNAGWSKEFVWSSGTHILGRARVSNLPASGWKTQLEAGITVDLDDPAYDYLQNCAFVGLRNCVIRGEPGAKLKNKDLSIPSVVPSGMAPVADGNIGQTNNRMCWGTLNFMDCDGVIITGFDIDGNRLGQTHTSVLVSGAVNHGIMLWGNCKNIRVWRAKIYGQGALQTSADKGGDCVYARCGVENILIDDCDVTDWGRWAFVLERGFPTPGLVSKTLFKISNCIIKAGNAEDGGIQLGAVDIESWNAWNFVQILNNLFSGSSSKISFGSSPDPFVQECAGPKATGNTWDFRTYVSATINTDSVIGIGGSWGVITGSSVEKKRTVLGIDFSNNLVLAKKGFGNFINLSSIKGKGGRIVGNHVLMEEAAPDNYSLLSTSSFGLDGDWIISSNICRGKKLMAFNNFQDTFDESYTTVLIADNIASNATKAFEVVLPSSKISATGTVSVTAGSKLLSGVGTAFTTELVVGQEIRIAGSGETYRIASIFTNTSAQLSVNAVTTAAASVYTRANVICDFRGNIGSRQSNGAGSTLTANGSLLRYHADTCFLENSNAIAADVITPGKGVATILNGQASITVPHFLRGDPKNFGASLNGPGGTLTYTAANANLGTLTINLAAVATQDIPVSWYAVNGNGA